MKYLFFAHSHTLTLCSLGTIEYLGLDHKDCIFLCTRNYIMPEGLTDCELIDANDAFNDYNHNLTGSVFENWRAIKKFDGYLREWTNDSEYFFFTPHLWGGIYILIASYRKCKKVSFVQEGAFTIQSKFINHLSLASKIYRWFNSLIKYGSFREYLCSGWYTDGCLPFQSKIDLYATTRDFFKYMPLEKCIYHEISWPNCKVKPSIDHPESPIFVFDGYVKNGIVENDIYMEACKKLILENHSKHNYVKFHPGQSMEERNLIISFFKKLNLNVEVFPETIPMEFYISSCNGLSFVGFSSSLLFYAKEFGHKVIARTSWLLNSKKFKAEAEKGYPVFDN